MENEKLKEYCWAITKNCLKDDEPIHGIPHIERVYENFELLKNNNSGIKEEILKSLEYAVILHDIGHREGPTQHALRSVQILKKEFAEIFSQLPNKEWVEYAISRHSEGAKENPDDEKEKCLAFLIILDHMDALGERGIRRDFIDLNFNKPLIPQDKNYTKEDVENIFKGHKTIDRQRKDESILERLLLNGYYLEKNLKRVESELKEEFKNKYRERANLTKRFCLNLIKLK